MTHEEKIQQEVEKTLQSLDGLKRAEANPFLFTRIKARMQKEKKNGWEMLFSFVSKPVVAMAILVFVMAVNGWSVFSSGPQTEGSMTTVSETEFTSVPEFEREYRQIISADNYDYENNSNE